jgi:hypothetical protein
MPLIMKKKNIRLMMVVSLLFASKAFALEMSQDLEVTQYTNELDGLIHNVTVAFDDLGHSGTVRCLITSKGKPVGMDEQYIKGVGTITILIPGGVNGKTSVSCQEV